MAQQDELLAHALLGTSKHPGSASESAHPTDCLLPEDAKISPERSLLLKAGARAVFRTAGHQSTPAPTCPTPPEPETKSICSPQAAALFEEFLNRDNPSLRLEAIHRLTEAGLRLPPELVPRALAEKQTAVRRVIPAVLGNVGVWLAQFNEEWKWLRGLAPEAPSLAQQETLWTEGNVEQRLAVLTSMRQRDPALARSWLEKTWTTEKADVRAQLVECLRIGLSMEDEPFLEKSLTDRDARVRSEIAKLLRQLPASAYSSRMRDRAKGCLQLSPAKDGKAASLTISTPEKFEKAWEKDSIVEKPPQGVGSRAYWLEQIMRCIPLTFWETQLNLSPEQMIDEVSRTEHGEAVLSGWAHSACEFSSEHWLPLLWDYWIGHPPARGGTFPREQWMTVCSTLCRALPATLLDLRIATSLSEQGVDFMTVFLAAQDASPTFWSVTFARHYLEFMRAAALRAAGQDFGQHALWIESLDLAAQSLPAECFERALRPWEVPPETDYVTNMWRNRTDKFVETIAARKRFREFVPLPKTEERHRGEN